MSFKTECPDCGQHFECDDEMEGQIIACPTCKEVITIYKRPEINIPQSSVTNTKLSQQQPLPPPQEPIWLCPHCGEMYYDSDLDKILSWKTLTCRKCSKPLTETPEETRSLLKERKRLFELEKRMQMEIEQAKERCGLSDKKGFWRSFTGIEWGPIGCLAIIIAFVIYLVYLNVGAKNSEPTKSDYQAFFEYGMKKRLWDSKNASFKWDKAFLFDDKTFKGYVSIRSTNAFGGYVTERFVVKGEYRNGNIHVEWEKQ